jgi:competence CoiA-like predicted nuclease
MASFKVNGVYVDPRGVETFLKTNKPVRDMLAKTAGNVLAEAQSTASEAENGAGGRVTGYAAAGFKIVWIMNGKRPQVRIVSNADSLTATQVHFYTQKRDGVAHLRAALYKFVGSQNYKVWPIGQNYKFKKGSK